MLRFVFRYIPIGLFTLFIMILTINTVWMVGMTTGMQIHENDTKTLQSVHTDLDESQQRVMTNISEDPEVDKTTRTMFGFSISEYVTTVYAVGHDGVDVGYKYPDLASVLVRYHIPILLPVFWYGVIKHKRISDVIGFFRGEY